MAVNTRQIVLDALSEVVGSIEHGECFYNVDMMGELLEDIDGLKNACLAYRVEVASEEDDD